MTPQTSGGNGSGCRTAELIALIPAMRALARCVCVDAARADALARESLVTAWARRNGLGRGSDRRAWVFAIVCERFRAMNEGELPAAPPSETLLMALADLPADRREVLALVEAAGLTHRSAAEICGSSRGSIKYRVKRARRELVAAIAAIDAEGAMRPALAAA